MPNPLAITRFRNRYQSHADCFHHKCLFANARPEPDFRYCSKAAALPLSSNRTTATILHGRNVAVCADPPELWFSKRLLRSSVMPI